MSSQFLLNFFAFGIILVHRSLELLHLAEDESPKCLPSEFKRGCEKRKLTVVEDRDNDKLSSMEGQ